MSNGPVPTVFEAIVRKRCLRATYNRTDIMLAPHIIYTRHDDLFVDGVVLERDGKPPKELKLGTFKLAGLNGVGRERAQCRAIASGRQPEPRRPRG